MKNYTFLLASLTIDQAQTILPYHVWYHWKALEQENTIKNKVFLLFLIRKINETKTSKNLESVL